ncbi:MAG: plasmid mobilization protein, partial [Edaphobacter sp.]
SYLRRAALAWHSSKISIRRCSLKPPLRTKSVGTKVSEAEFALLEERARGAGMRLAEWVREALLAAPVEPGAGSGVDSGEVALGEILALRSLLLNLHFRAAKGEPVAEAEMRGLIERADGTKIERARERMAAVRAATRATVPEPESEAETAVEMEPEES